MYMQLTLKMVLVISNTNHYKFNDTVNVLPDWASNCASICELAYAARQK